MSDKYCYLKFERLTIHLLDHYSHLIIVNVSKREEYIIGYYYNLPIAHCTKSDHSDHLTKLIKLLNKRLPLYTKTLCNFLLGVIQI